MSRNKIHSDGISVAFKWEKQPGVSKTGFEDRGNKKQGSSNPKTMATVKPMMSRNKNRSSDGVSVPFKWERKPGVSMMGASEGNKKLGTFLLDHELPPPPFRAKNSSRSSKKSVENDPFLMAFKECTKSKSNDLVGEAKFEGGFGFMRKSLWRVSSCKQSIGVRDDVFITTTTSTTTSRNYK